MTLNRTLLAFLLVSAACGGEKKNNPPPPPPDQGCTPELAATASGGATDVREVVIAFSATGCAAIEASVRRDGRYVPAASLGNGDFRAWVVLESGSNTFEIVAFVAGEETVGPSVTFDYTPATPSTNAASGFVVGEVLDAADDSPIPGATVYLRDVAGEVQTDANGEYEFPTPAPGRYVLTVEAAGYTFAQRPFAVSTGTRRRVDTVYLVALDTKTVQITPEAGGTLVNTAGDVELVVPPGAVKRSVDVSAVTFPKHETLPGPLPDSSRWTQALNLSPDGVRFDAPATLRTENVLGFSPGTEVPVGYYNRGLAAWEPEAMGVVSADGQWIDLEVNHFSPYDCNFPTEEDPPPGSGLKKPDPCKEGSAGASLVNDSTGALKLFVPVSQAVRGDRKCAARITYDSAQATGVMPFVFPISIGDMSGLEEVSSELTLEGRRYTSSLAVSGTPTAVYFLGEQLLPFTQWGSPIASGLYSLQMRVTASATVNYMTADVFGGPGVEDTGVATREPVPFDNRRIVPLVFRDESASPLGAGWTFEEAEQLYVHPSGEMVAWDRTRGASIIYMGYPDTPVLDAAAYAFVDDLVDFFVLDDGRVVIVNPHGVHVAPDFASFDQAAEIANISDTILMAAAGHGGVALFDNNFQVRWVGLGGSVGAPIDPAAVLADAGVIGFTFAGLWTAMTADRDNFVYIDLAGYGIARVAGLDTGEPTVDLMRIMDIAGNGDPAVVDLDYSPWEHALYALMPAGGVIQRIDLDTGTASTVATAGSVIRGGDSDAFARIFSGPDGSVWVGNYGDLGRITPEGIPARITSFTYNYSGVQNCDLDIVRFDPAGEPVVHCGSSGGTVQKFFAVNWQHGRDLRFDQLLERTGSGYTLTGTGELRTFDTQGRLLERTIGGVTETFTYTGNLLTTYSDGFGGSVQLDYTGGELTRIVDQGGGTSTVTIDGSGDLSQLVDPDGRTLTFSYTGHRMQQRTADGLPVTYAWNATGGVASAALPTGEVRQYESLLESIGTGGIADDTATSVFTDGEGYAFTQRFAWHGMVTEVDAAGRLWDVVITPELFSDGSGPSFMIDAARDDQSEVVQLAADEDRFYTASVNGAVVYFANYDDQKRPTRVSSFGRICNIAYEAQGIDDVTCNSRFYMDLIYSDADSLPDAVDDYNGERWSLTRDAHGNVETITDPLGGVVTFTRNQGGFVTNIEGANSHSLGVDRDAAGNPTAFHLPAAGESVTVTWDRVPTCAGCVEGFADFVSSVTDGLSNTWSMSVRADGRVASVTNPLSQVRTFSYDNRRFLTGITGPGTTDVTFAYDAQGEVTSFVIDGATTSFTHDSLSRWLTADGPAIDMSRTYNDNPIGYDEVTTQPGGPTYAVSATANVLYANLASFAVTGGEGLTVFGFEDGNQTLVSFDASGTVAALETFARNQGGNLDTRFVMSRSETPVVTYTYTHDQVHRPSSVTVLAGATTDTMTFTYDGSMPYLTAATASTGALLPSLTFTHDSAGRLTGVGGDVTAAYTYDLAGRLASTDYAGTFTYDAAGRLSSTSVATYTYEPRGTRLSRTDGSTGEVWRYTFDSADRLTAVEKYVDGAAVTPYSTVSLAYDPLWRLSSINVDSTTTYLVWAEKYLIAELDGGGAVVRQWVPMVRPDDPVMVIQGGQDYYYVKDWTGSVHHVVDDTGAVVASYSYDGFGRLLSATGTLAAQPRRFAGAYYLEAAGLYYMHARWYDPEIGQFISEDPQMHLAPFVHPYIYAANDPTRFVDTTGFGATGPSGGGGGGLWGPSNGGPPSGGNTMRDIILDPLKGEILGDVGTAYDILDTLSQYNSDPINNAEVGIKFIFDKTLLSHSPVLRDIADSFIDFAKGVRDFFGSDPC